MPEVAPLVFRSADVALEGRRGGREDTTKLSRRRATCISSSVAYRDARCMSSRVPSRSQYGLDINDGDTYWLGGL